MKSIIAVDRAAVVSVGRRPDLWLTAVRVGLRLAAPGWWRRWPPRLQPDSYYLRFRLETMYGDAGVCMTGPDLVKYLEWCRRARRPAR